MTLRLSFLSSLLLGSPAVFGQIPPPQSSAIAPAEEMIDQIKLPDAPLETVLQLLEQWTGRTILRPAALPTATTTLMITRPMPKSEAIRALETILNMNQIGVTPMGDNFLKVVALPALRTEAPRMLQGSALELPASGAIMAKVFQLNFLRANEFVPQLAQLLNPQLGGPILFEKTNAVMITDSVSTLQRIETLIDQLDKPVTANLTPKFYPLQFAKASVLVNQLRTILQGAVQSQLGSATSYSSDDRTNQVILLADPRQHAFFDSLIAKLDIKADPNTRNEVIYLKHASAEDVATLLSNLISGQTQAASKAGSSTSSVRPGQGAATVGAATPPGAIPAPAPAATVNIENVAGQLGINGNEFSSFVTVIPEKRANAVVVNGTVEDVRIIRELIEKVDVLLAQVRVEVVIAEVTLNDNTSTGISSLGLDVSGDKLVGFRGAASGLTVGSSATSGFATITRPGTTGAYDLAGIITLGANSNKSNITILANPTLVTTHNKEASIFVGESRPVFGQIQTVDTINTGTNNPSALRSSITQQEAGINLKIKPLIGADGTVQLEIEQTFNAFGPDVSLGDGLTQPSINKREAKSFVNVGDKEIVVLGGYQSNSRNRSRSRLGPIPIIGDLLGPRSFTVSRTELMVFIRPHVIRTVDDTTEDALTKMKTSSDADAVYKSLEFQKASPATAAADDSSPASSSPSLRRPK